jgi:RNA polymerase sigma factor (TIGR02999 family)
MSEFTVLLEKSRQGEPLAAGELVPRVYAELRRVAATQLAHESAALTLQPTALVHEAWLRLGGTAQPDWQSRRHFFGAAAQAMRQILIERARRRRGAKHGGGHHRADASALDLVSSAVDTDEVIAVTEALDRFATIDSEKAELVRLRYYVGLTIEETAATMEISVATAKRHWTFARAWLAREMKR